jgi:hypothetical protein
LDYCITVRDRVGNQFGNGPGSTSFLKVQAADTDFNSGQIIGSADWVREVLLLLNASKKRDATGAFRSDLLVFIHGFDNKPPIVLQRHRRLSSDLSAAGFEGVVISFDWPSGAI